MAPISWVRQGVRQQLELNVSKAKQEGLGLVAWPARSELVASISCREACALVGAK
jgi:hypothetical protein